MMLSCHSRTLKRRQFLRTAGGLVAGAFGAVLARADELPKNTNPRAISGDTVEPDWRRRVTVTVIKNELRETREPASRIGILIEAQTRDIRCIDNQNEGFATAIADLRKK